MRNLMNKIHNVNVYFNTIKNIFIKNKWILFELALSFLISFISIRYFLINSGYYWYSDQHWPLNINFYGNESAIPSIIADGYLHQFLQLSRDVITWPYFLIRLFSPNIQIAEKAYIFYTFLFYVFMSFLIIEHLIKTIIIKANLSISKFKEECIKIVIVVYLFSNFTSMDYNVDGGTTADSIIMLLIILSFSIILRGPKSLDFIPLGLAFAITAFLDPDYIGFILLSTLILLILLILLKFNNVISIYIWFYSFILFLPFFIFIYWGLDFNNIGYQYIYMLRPLSPWGGGNISDYPWAPFVLLGYIWSTMNFAPPSIIFYSDKINTLPGLFNPTGVILPPGIVTIIWMITIFSIPFFAIFSVIFKKTRKFSISMIILIAIFFILIFYYSIPPLFSLIKMVVSIPIIGGAIETSLALPDHMLIIIAAGYATLLSILFINIFNNQNNAHNKKFKIKYKTLAKKILIIFIIFAILFSGWQAFNGNYYPARSNYSSFSGNGVSNGGAYEPFKVPDDVFYAYNMIIQDHSTFNVYWPILYGQTLPQVASGSSSAKVLSYFPYLVKNDLKNDIVPYMNSDGVKYLVIENVTYVPPDLYTGYYKNLSSLFYIAYGMYSYMNEINFLKTVPGLNLIYYSKNISVFENIKFNGAIYNASLLLNYKGSQSNIPALYSLFNTMNISSTVTNYKGYGVNTSIDNLNGTIINILSPADLSKYTSPLIFFNSTSLTGNVAFEMNHSRGEYGYMINPYYIALWSGNISGEENNGSFIFKSTESSTVSLSLFSALTNNQTAVPLPNSNGTYIVKFTTSLYWSNNSTSPGIVIYGNNETLSSSYVNGVTINKSQMNKTIELSWAVPSNIKYVTVRVGAKFQGLLKINYYNLSLYFIPKNYTLPFGNSLSFENITNELQKIIEYNSTSLTGNVAFEMNHSRGEYGYMINPYYIALWSGNISGEENNGSFIFKSTESSTVSLSLFSALTNNQTAVPLPNSNGTYIVKFTTSLYWSNNSTSPGIVIYGNNETLSSSYVNGVTINKSQMNKTIELSWAVPSNIKYVTVRVGAKFQGLLKINYYNLSLYFIPKTSYLPALSYANYNLIKNEISLTFQNDSSGNYNNTLYIYFKGSLNVNNFEIFSKNFSWEKINFIKHINITGNGCIASIIILKNASSISKYFQDIVVNTAIISNELSIIQNGKIIKPIPSVEGFAIYILYNGSKYQFNYINFDIANFINAILIITIYLLIIFYFYKKYKRHL
jgi:hypothetical protein